MLAIYDCDDWDCAQANIPQFTPELPRRKQAAIKRLGYGLLNKLSLEFPTVFWESKYLVAYYSLHHTYMPILLLQLMHHKLQVLLLLRLLHHKLHRTLLKHNCAADTVEFAGL